MKKTKSPFWIGPLLAAMACVVYLWTMSVGAFPGESAALISRVCGAQPLLSTANPLWHMVAAMVSALPVGTVAARLNLLSVLGGCCALWLMYHVMSNIICLLMDPGIADDRHVARAGALAGVASAMALGFSAPFWIASTRAHVAAFDLCLLLGLAALFVDYIRHDSRRSLIAFALLYGIGTAEFATCVIFAPFFASVLIFVLWTRNDLNAKTLFSLGGFSVVGLLLFPLAAWHFMGTEMQLLQKVSYGEVLWSAIRGHYMVLAYSLPVAGWLLVLVVTALPWMTCLLTARRSLNGDLEPGYLVLHLLMFFLTLLLFFNFDAVSPWKAQAGGRLLLTPYALAAMVYGYVAAYLYIHAKTASANTKPIAALLESRLMQGIILCVPVIIVLVAGGMNFRVADGRPAGVLNRYASALVDGLGGSTWLITDGTLDDVILLAAHEAGRPLTVINGRMGDNEFYMRYVATKFEDIRLKSMTEVGLGTLIQEWITGDPSVTGRLAVALTPDVWISAGMVAVPHGGVFLGARDLRGLDAAKIIEQHEQFWNAQVPGLRASADARNPVSGISLQLLRHCSLVANNLGVMLADMGRTNDAYRTYARARDILPQNISALLNQHLLIQGGYVATNVAQVEKDFQTLAGTNAAARSAWGLSRNFGYVRTPEAFMAMGMTWALSGNPAMAVAGAKRAVSLTGGRQVAAKQGLAYLYMTRNQNMESEALYRDILGKDSNNWAACVGLARVSVKKGDFEKASTYLIRADLLKAPKAAVEMERAALLYAQGDFERSRAILKKVITTDPEQTDAWLMLAGILIQKGSTGEELDECLKTLSPHKSDASVAMITGYAALARKDPALARREFERALVLRPGSVSMLEVLLNMDFSEGQKELAQKHVKQLLSINPEHAYGNYILAKLQMDRKEYALAEDSLRRSSAANPTALVVNDLAWVQVCRGAMAEAEQSARRAIELDPKADYAYDTLGVALTRLNRFNDAQQALETALVLNQSQTSAFLHLAELSAIKGERSKATGYLDVLEERRKDLSAGELETITKLRRRLQENL